MFVKKVAAAVAALMLTASPVVAQSAAVPAPQSETVSAANNLQGAPEALGIIVGVTIIGLILYILLQDDDEEEDGFEPAPVSP